MAILTTRPIKEGKELDAATAYYRAILKEVAASQHRVFVDMNDELPWLETDAGKQALREAGEKAKEAIARLKEMRKISYKELHTPYDI